MAEQTELSSLSTQQALDTIRKGIGFLIAAGALLAFIHLMPYGRGILWIADGLGIVGLIIIWNGVGKLVQRKDPSLQRDQWYNRPATQPQPQPQPQPLPDVAPIGAKSGQPYPGTRQPDMSAFATTWSQPQQKQQATPSLPHDGEAEAVFAQTEGTAWTDGINWEEWIGKKLLQKLGIIVVLIGMLVLMKYSFDNRWIGELGRIGLSVLGAIALIGAGEWFQSKYAQWAQAFTGGGLALLYFTVWVADVFYEDALLLHHNIYLSAGATTFLYGLWGAKKNIGKIGGVMHADIIT